MRLQEYQRAQVIAELGQRYVSFVEQGGGVPMILLHGLPTWGFLWAGLLPALAMDFKVIVPDLLGFGYSDKRDRFDRSIAAQADMIIELMDALALPNAVIVGHDVGGGVALRLAVTRPERLRGLCLINSISYDAWPVEMMLQLGHPAVDSILSARAVVRLLSATLRSGFSHKPPRDLIHGLLAPYTTEVGKLSLIRDAAALNTNLTTELTHRLAELTLPTQIIWGKEDKYQLVAYGRRLASDIPGARLAELSARHFVMLDEPHKVLDILRNFALPLRHARHAEPASQNFSKAHDERRDSAGLRL